MRRRCNPAWLAPNIVVFDGQVRVIPRSAVVLALVGLVAASIATVEQINRNDREHDTAVSLPQAVPAVLAKVDDDNSPGPAALNPPVARVVAPSRHAPRIARSTGSWPRYKPIVNAPKTSPPV